jgi:hypothetical protein
MNTMTMGESAAAALKTFPFPQQGGSMTENYRRILGWLYEGRPSPAHLIIALDLGLEVSDSAP